MRQIREILRLYHEQHDSLRMISRSLAMSHVAVKKVVDRAQAAGYTWPLDPECTDAVLLGPGVISPSSGPAAEAAGTRLEHHPSRTAAERGDACAAVAGI